MGWGVGQIGMPLSESGSIHILGFALPLKDDSTIVASVTPALRLGGALHLKLEEIAATNEIAASQAASLATLLTLARGFTDPLAQSPANNGLKQLLQTAAVDQNRNRVVVTATLSPALLTDLGEGEEKIISPATLPETPASQ
jgi:hypothetical protein